MDIQKWFVGTVPATVLMAAHWFPWRKWLRRDLGRLEAYAIGMVVVVGAASLVLEAEEELPGKRAASLVGLSAVSGGLGTLFAWGVDIVLSARRYKQFQAELGDALYGLQGKSQRGKRVDRQAGG